jgi:iron(III) transport system permease protein
VVGRPVRGARFLVAYPVAMLLLGALTNTNPGGGRLRRLQPVASPTSSTVLANPNVHLALANSLIACAGGTALAVVIGLTFSWVVVRTNTPCKRFIAAASMLPLFVPPLVAAVAWSILASPRTGLLNTFWRHGHRLALQRLFDGRLICIFGIYYAPYVYMFTGLGAAQHGPALEEAAEVPAPRAAHLFTVTFPLIAPAIISGMLLSFIVMLGIYGIPAVLGTPATSRC